MKKVIAVFSVVAGVFILVCDLLFVMIDAVGFASAVAFLFAGAVFLFYGLKHLKTKAPVSSSVPSRVVIISEERPHYSFKVAGTSYRKKDIADILFENDDYSLSKKALISDNYIDERVYKYNSLILDAELVPEPDNPHSSNAIKIVVSGTHIGYVPEEKISAVRKVLANKNVKEISCEIYGGDYKVVEEDDDGEYILDKVSQNFGAEVTIYYSDNKIDTQTQVKR